ncbi:hypothetical protein [Sphingomonas sp. AX6]|uniref:hypothetical protein n=1 Tax=Sphingomonas sp. AX6 TaxID=2653171 RepID=UPI0012F35BB8|nr:hypothetical protein [Sphingomonas sp. AX6]VXD01127.1 conserved hypothetical protein [Sphingomonas sp. AX6]
MRRAVALALLLAGCSEAPVEVPGEAVPSLEAAAIARGLVPDPDAAPLTGLFARDADRLCLRADVGEDRAVMGLSIDYGEGNGCAALGTASRQGETLSVDLGEACRFDAGYDGEAIRFPGALPDGCANLCRGNASLAGMTTVRLSHSAGEVAAFRDRRGRFPCAETVAAPS